MKTIVHRIDIILKNALAGIMAFMVLNVLWQVFSRYVLNSPSSFTDELARYLLIWLGVLGASYVSGAKSHLALDLLKEKVSDSKKIVLDKVISLLILLFALGAMVIGGSRLVYITYFLGQKSAALQLPLAVVYSIIPVSGLVIVLYKLHDIFSDTVESKADKDD